MRLPTLLSLASTLALSLTAAACGDDPSIVATWRTMPHAFDDEPPTVAERDVWQFNEDGTMSITDEGEVVGGTYTLNGDRLSFTLVEEGDTESVVSTVVVTDDRLLFGALTPAGDVDGAVGTWTGDFSLDGEVVTVEMDLRADGTGDFTRRTGANELQEYSGTWEEQGESVRYSYEPDPNFTVNFELFRIGDEGLGGPLFEKI